jgi:hypothetical protein
MSISFTQVQFDKPAYNPGDTVTVIVSYSSTDTQPTYGDPTVHHVDLTVISSSGEQHFPAHFNVNGPATNEPYPAFARADDITDPVNPVQFTLVSNAQDSFDPSSGASTWTAEFTLTLPSA